MGTRHLIAVQLDGEYKLAQYGQWDGYPDGNGVEVLKFLRDKMTEQFLTNLSACRFGTDEEIKETWTECGATGEWVGSDVANKHTELHPALSRDTGAEVLGLIQQEPRVLANQIDFAGDSVFCEWAYVIDFDKGTFEVFKGFNKQDLDPSERFFATPDGPGKSADGKQYKPVKLVHTFHLDKLPSDAVFLEICCPEDD